MPVSGQNVSCVCIVVSYFETVVFFFNKNVFLSNFVIDLINWLQDFMSSNSVCNHTRN